MKLTELQKNMRKIKAQDLKFGDYVEELGIIKSITVEGNSVLLEALPRHLEYYGLENTGKVSINDEFIVHNIKETIMYIFHCVTSLSRAKEDCKNAEYKFLKWLREHEKDEHIIKHSSKILKHVKKNEVVDGYGLILRNGKSKLFGKREIKMIGKSFKIFSTSTMFSIDDGFNDIVDIINNDDNKIEDFILKTKQEIIDTNALIKDSISFLRDVMIKFTICESNIEEIANSFKTQNKIQKKRQ